MPLPLRRLAIVATAAILALLPPAASAQSTAWGTSGYLSFSALYEPGSTRSDMSTEQDINVETARIVASQETGHRLLGDLTAGGRIHGNLGIGVGLTFGRSTQDAELSGTVPHPLYFDQPRSLTGTARLRRDDVAVHADALVLLPVSASFQMTVFGGPTWFQITQQTIQSLMFEETYPFDTVTVSGQTLEEQKGSHFGFNAGADASFFFSRYLGVQGMARYVRGTVHIGPDGHESSIDINGTQVGGGLRVRF